MAKKYDTSVMQQTAPRTLATHEYETRLMVGTLTAQTDLNKQYQFTHSDRVNGTFHGHRIYMSPQAIGCRDCEHVLGVPPLIRDSGRVTRIAYRLYLFGKLIDEPCSKNNVLSYDPDAVDDSSDGVDRSKLSTAPGRNGSFDQTERLK